MSHNEDDIIFDWKSPEITIVRKIRKRLADAVVENMGDRTGFFCGVSDNDLANLIFDDVKSIRESATTKETPHA